MSGNKCTASDLCTRMAARVDESDRGLVSIYSENVKTGEPRFLGVAYKINKKDRGLMLNTCPWCGGEPGDFQRATPPQGGQP